MTLFETVKDRIAIRDAAEHYGININSRGMALCPFHDDHHPSMRVYDDHYHCFACGAHGDVIDLAACLFGLQPKDAAKKLLSDFGISEDRYTPQVSPRAKPFPRECHDVLLALELKLRGQKLDSLPTSPDEAIPLIYAKSCQMYDYIIAVSDLLEGGTEEEKTAMLEHLRGGTLDRYRAALKKDVIDDEDIF